MKRKDIAGLVIIVACITGFVGGLGLAYAVDHANGVSVDQSLRSAGL